MNKQGIELAVNFFVTLILTLVVLGIGIYMARNLFFTSYAITDDSFEKFDRQTEALYCQGTTLVCIGRDTATLGSTNHHVFTLHILNVGMGDGTFTVNVAPGPWFEADGSAHEASTNPILYLPHSRPVFIENTKETNVGIAVQRTTTMAKGTYTVDVEVLNPNGYLYGGKQRLNIKII